MDRSELRGALLAWFDRVKRRLPWREDTDPYRVWVSEIMLQQTQVETVERRYEAFLARFPDVTALASASELQVCEAWAGLGYYRRARLLHKAAVEIVTVHDGVFPSTAVDWMALPGVGRYTAGAVASIAFGEAAPIVDGNVERILSRIFLLTDPPKSSPGQKMLWKFAEELAVGERPGDLNQAMMELGSQLCSPRSPKCDACPVREACRARKEGRVDELPVPNIAPVRRELRMAYVWIPGARGGVYLRQRPLGGLWPGMWEPPGFEGDDADSLLQRAAGVPLSDTGIVVSHVLTHRDVRARIWIPNGYVARLGQRMGAKLVRLPEEAPLSGLARKVIGAMGVTARNVL